MKKFAKGCLIAALSMLIIGIIIVVTCIFIGGSTLFSYATDRVKADFDISLDNYPIILHGNNDTDIEFHNDYPTHQGDFEDFEAAPSSTVTNLDLIIGAGKCIISKSSDDYFHIYSKNAEKYQYYTENHTLYIKGFKHSSHHENGNVIYLEIPKNFYFENISIELGAGNIETDELLAKNNIDIYVGAGHLSAELLVAENKLTSQVGAGNIEIQNGSVKDSDMMIGFGHMTYNGVITNDLSSECGMGSLTLQINDAYEKHNYDIELMMGSMIFNGTTHSAVSYTDFIDNDADSTYSLKCGMGNMSISIK